MHQILLIEDDVDQMRILESVVKRNFKQAIVDKAYSGNEAIAKLSVVPDLVILDLMLPERSGFDICKYLRSDTKYKVTKVIAYSVLEDKEMIKKAFASGVDDYVIKLSDVELLIEKMNKFLL